MQTASCKHSSKNTKPYLVPLPYRIIYNNCGCEVKMKIILPNIYLLKSLIVRQYLLVDDNQLYLVDAGLPGNSKAILRALSELHIVPTDITLHVLITHADGDHVGSLSELRDSFPNIKVYASAFEAEAIRGGHSSRPLKPKGFEKVFYNLLSPLFVSPASEVDCILNPGDVLPVFSGLRVIDSSGHTPGHISFYLPKERVLFAGDSIRGSNHSPAPSIGANTWDIDKARGSFDSQLQLQPAYICAGHYYSKLI